MQSLNISLRKIPLWLLLLLTLAGYALLRLWFPLAPYSEHVPAMDIRKFTPTLASGLAYAVLLLLLFGLFALAFQKVRALSAPPRLWFILLITAVFCLSLLQTYPFNATDVYRYVIQGRISSVYEANPFEAPPANFPDDPYLPFAGEWAEETTPYGPVWELLATAVTHTLRSTSLLNLLTAFKVVGMLAHLCCAVLIWQMLTNAPPARQAGYTILWAWNPALLLTFVVDAHNDVLMILWLLLGLLVIRQGHPTAGLLLMLLAPLTKMVALLPIPLFFIAGWHTLPTFKAKLRYLATTVLGGLILTVLVFLPFGSPLPLVARLLYEASNAPGFSFSSVVLLIFLELNGQPPLAQVALVGSLLFVVFAVWLLWRTWKNGRSPIRGSAEMFAGYIAQATSFRIWYATWPFPWLLLDDTNTDSEQLSYRLKVGLWFLVTSQLSVLIYGHVRHYLLGGEQFWAHLIGVPFTFLLPFALAKRGEGSRQVEEP